MTYYAVMCMDTVGEEEGGGGVPSGALAWRRVELWCVPTVQTASEPLFFVTTSRRCVLRYDTVVCCVMIRLCVELW